MSSGDAGDRPSQMLDAASSSQLDPDGKNPIVVGSCIAIGVGTYIGLKKGYELQELDKCVEETKIRCQKTGVHSAGVLDCAIQECKRKIRKAAVPPTSPSPRPR